ncbi:MAG: hypothetical protein PHU85_08265 [Phycisphaerae bacterium]|nr:hypothetical protein [Phycisphaerae bacterium]
MAHDTFSNLPEPPYLLDSWLRVDFATGQVIEGDRLKSPNGAGSTIRLSAARNEYVSFQVVLPADWLGPKLRVSLSGAASGAAVTSREFDWFVEFPFKSGATWYPDALVPGKSIEAAEKLGLLSRINRPRVFALWVDLFIPREAKPGRYAGTLRVQSEARHEADLGIELSIWPFAIDDECHVTADMNSYSASFVTCWPQYDRPDPLAQAGARRILHAYYRMAHEHRSMLHSLNYTHSGMIPAGFAPELVGDGDQIRVKSWTLFDQCFGPAYDGSAFRGTRRGEIPVPYSYTPFNLMWPASFIWYDQPGYKVAWQRIGEQFVEHAKQHGWTRTKFEIFFNHKKRYRYFPFDGDETRFTGDEQVFRDFHDMIVGQWRKRKDVRIVYRTDSSWMCGLHSQSDVADIFDLWVVSGGIGGCYKSGMENLIRKGHDVWFYGGASGYQSDLIEMGRWPLVPWMRGGNGFTPWLTTDGGKTPFASGPTGDGRTGLFYPGAELGLDAPIANLRTKAMRNSMQTIEYLWLLAARENGSRARTWDLVNRVMGVDWSAWWRKPDAFMHKPPHEWQNADFSTAPKIDTWSHSDPRDLDRLRSAAADELSKSK